MQGVLVDVPSKKITYWGELHETDIGLEPDRINSVGHPLHTGMAGTVEVVQEALEAVDSDYFQYQITENKVTIIGPCGWNRI